VNACHPRGWVQVVTVDLQTMRDIYQLPAAGAGAGGGRSPRIAGCAAPAAHGGGGGRHYTAATAVKQLQCSVKFP
jgi:hypothetical protein